VALRIMPSILSADFANLQTAIESVPSSDAIHVDVMDNHFVPNLTLGLPVVESIRKATDKMLDIHLMIEQPDRWAPAYAEAGAQSVTFHIEAAGAPVRLARELQSRGAGSDGPQTGYADRTVRGPLARARHGVDHDRGTGFRRPGLP